MEAIKTKIRKTATGDLIFGYCITGEPKDIITLINNEGFVPSFDENGNPLIWRKQLLDPAIIEISAKGRIALYGIEQEFSIW